MCDSWESNPEVELGKLICYHYITIAWVGPGAIRTRIIQIRSLVPQSKLGYRPIYVNDSNSNIS